MIKYQINRSQKQKNRDRTKELRKSAFFVIEMLFRIEVVASET